MSILQRATESLRNCQEIIIISDEDALSVDAALDLIINTDDSTHVGWLNDLVGFDVEDNDLSDEDLYDRICISASACEDGLLKVVNKLKELNKDEDN